MRERTAVVPPTHLRAVPSLPFDSAVFAGPGSSGLGLLRLRHGSHLRITGPKLGDHGGEVRGGHVSAAKVGSVNVVDRGVVRERVRLANRPLQPGQQGVPDRPRFRE